MKANTDPTTLSSAIAWWRFIRSGLAWGLLLAFGLTLLIWLGPQATPARAQEPTFEPAHFFESNETQSLALGDLDGDGDLDIIQGRLEGKGQAYLNDGQGDFSERIDFDGENLSTQSAVLGDLDGDGDLDIVQGNRGQQSRILWNERLNDGKVHFPNITAFGITNTTQSVAVGDLDSNGKLDIVQGNDGQPSLVFLNQEGGFSNGVALGITNTTRSIALGDLDGDGDLDIVQGNDGFSLVFLNDGEGSFSDGVTFGSTNTTRSIALGDLDGDGDLDIVQGNDGPQSLVFLNDGEGSFSDGVTFGSTNTTRSIALGDLDGDGYLDIVQGNEGFSLVFLNDGRGSFPDGVTFSGNGLTRSVTVGDLNGDGALDIVQGIDGQFGVVYLNNGQGRFFADSVDEGEANETLSIAIGDLDGDGDLDIVQGNEGQPSQVFLNDGQGHFPKSDPFGITNTTRSVAVGDLDGDGDLDIIQGNMGQLSRVFRNDGLNAGQLQFSEVITFGSATDQTRSIALGDLDGDRDLDIVQGNEGQPSQVFLNDGQISFSKVITFGGGATDSTQSVALGDLDDDGDLDIVQGNFGNLEKSLVFLNEGPSEQKVGFSDGVPFGSTNNTLSVAVGDINGDGALDIVQGNVQEPSFVYLNDGQGHFSTDGSRFGLANGTRSVAVGDLNGDGALDIIQGNSGGQHSLVFLNEGQGHFSNGIAIGIPRLTRSVALGDLNGDGALDIVQGNGNAPNLQRSRVSLNGFRRMSGLTNNPPALTVTRPLTTGNANFYSTPVLLTDQTISLTYSLFDPEGDPVSRVAAFFSLNGGGDWQPALAASGTVTTNLATGRQVQALQVYTSGLSIPDGPNGVISVTLPVSAAGVISDLNVSLTISHTRDVDLQVSLVSPAGTPVTLLSGVGSSGRDFSGTVLDDQAATSIISGTAPFTGTYRPQDRLGQVSGQPIGGVWTLIITDTAGGGSGSLRTWGLRFKTPPVTHIYTWDTFASGLFGQSDNAVIRLVAYPEPLPLRSVGTYSYSNRVAGPYQWPYAAATTFPFRVRGTQVQVISGTQGISNAIVYRLPAGQPVGGFSLGQTFTRPFVTDNQGYLQGRGQMNIGDHLLALAPVSLPPIYTERYSNSLHLYYTNATPTITGLNSFTVTQSGVQTLTVSAANPLLLFDLEVSLEWDASNDPTYLQQLEFDLQRASEFLYDFSNGQVALGQVTVHQNGEGRDTAHIVVRATNRLRPFAVQGGIVLTETIDPDHASEPDKIVYNIGQVTMGSTWNRYGNAGQNLSQDWPLALAHELSHFLLFLDDTYLGLNEAELLIPVPLDPLIEPGCAGSAMGDVYTSDNTEFIFDDDHWEDNCDQTLTQQTLGRDEWATIKLWYPWLNAASVNPGPSLMPFDLTTVAILPPPTTTNTLADPTFNLDYQGGGVSSSAGQGFLQRGEQIIDLGSPAGGQNRLLARGAQPGDRLCAFDQLRPINQAPQAYFGCETISVGDERLLLERDDDWTPLITLSPVNSTTFELKVEALPGGLALRARLYPESGAASSEIDLTNSSAGYSGTLSLTPALTNSALAGHVQVWVESDNASESDPRRETIVAYSIGGNPGKQRGGGGKQRGGGAPLVSPDGQMIFFSKNPLVFEEDDFYTVQNMAGLPALPPGKTTVGPSYNLLATAGAPVISGSISFQYLGLDALVEGIDENSLRIHFWDGIQWQALGTVGSPYYNLASARSQGPGIYALLGGVTPPNISSITPSAATNEVTTTLVISGGYFLPPLVVELLGPTVTYTLPVSATSSVSVTAVVSQGLAAREYHVRVVNGDGGVSPTPGVFALYDPDPACFYDFFESGASKWQLGGDWAITSLPDGRQMMTDSPTGPYKSAGDYVLGALSYSTTITSTAFSLTSCPNPVLSFKQAYAIIPPGDRGRVEITTNEGASWQTLAAYATDSSSAVPAGQNVSLEWANVTLQPVELDLSAYTGTVRLRFNLEVNQNISDKGWVLDNVMVKVGTTSDQSVFLPIIIKGP